MPSTVHRHEVFPVFAAEDLRKMARYGEARHLDAGSLLKRAGERAPGLFVLLSGRVLVRRRKGLGEQVAIADHGPGEILGEIGQLEGAASFTDAVALEDVERNACARLSSARRAWASGSRARSFFGARCSWSPGRAARC